MAISDIPFDPTRVVANVKTTLPPTIERDLSYVIQNDDDFFKFVRTEELINIIEKAEKNLDVNYLPIFKNETYSLELSDKTFSTFREALEESVKIIYK